MIEGKGLGSKKINRVNISLNNKQNLKLNRLSTACGQKPTTLAAMLIDMCLNSPEIVAKLQSEYCIHTAYRVLPVKDFKTDELIYVLNDKESVL